MAPLKAASGGSVFGQTSIIAQNSPADPVAKSTGFGTGGFSFSAAAAKQQQTTVTAPSISLAPKANEKALVPQLPPGISASTTADIILRDFSMERPVWPFSSYGFSGDPCILAGADICPLEARVLYESEFRVSKATSEYNQYLAHVNTQIKHDTNTFVNAIQKNPQVSRNMPLVQSRIGAAAFDKVSRLAVDSTHSLPSTFSDLGRATSASTNSAAIANQPQLHLAPRGTTTVKTASTEVSRPPNLSTTEIPGRTDLSEELLQTARDWNVVFPAQFELHPEDIEELNAQKFGGREAGKLIPTYVPPEYRI
ncbi:hypothetical protein HDU84_002887 [Entophlyctis sp. JEL0112]|nr:hypothetical protein HDU84_002887 [Entophlyctis sp. JEL0112]